jgi:osomolarity two-component system response regulator SSK1
VTDAAENADPNNGNTMATKTTKPKKILSKTMTNFKLNKKKKKAKGTPFADVVSPPINVLIVEGKIHIFRVLCKYILTPPPSLSH